VTGAPRAGTTFVGQVLSLPLSVDYLHEPFNRADLEGFSHRFQYIRAVPDTEEMRVYSRSVDRVLAYDFSISTEIPPDDPLSRQLAKRIVGGRGAYYLRIAKLNPFHTAAVVKDPTAALLGKFLRTRYGVHPVTVVKHPVSLAASLQRLGWIPSPHWFASQTSLHEDFGDLVGETLRLDWSCPITAAAAHWKLLYGIQLTQAEEAQREAGENAWHVVLLERLSDDPIGEFQTLYAALGLPWSDRVARRIRKMTTTGGGEAREGQMQDLQRKSSEIFELRRQQLSPAERRRVFEITAPVALTLYDEASFALR